MSEKSSLTLINIKIDSSFASYGSILYFIENYQSTIVIDGCSFTNNTATYNLIDMTNSIATISNTKIQNNMNNLFNLVSSTLFLKELQINILTCITSLRGCILQIQQNSNIHIQSSDFSNVISKIEEGNIYLESSSINIDKIEIKNTKTPKKGSCFSSYNSSLIILNSNFKDYDLNCINSFESNLTINNSMFDNSEKNYTSLKYSDYGSVYSSSSKIIFIFNSSFIENSNVLDGSALYLIATPLDILNEVYIFNCIFSGNSAIGKGTIYIYNQNFSISYSNFDNNKAQRGGGIFCNNDGLTYFKFDNI